MVPVQFDVLLDQTTVSMCGIVGYIGEEQADDILLTGLKRLEYRGYDSAGRGIRHARGLRV